MTAQAGVFPLRFALQGGRPEVELAWEIQSDGRCLVDALTPASVPQTGPVRVGHFRTNISALDLVSLAAWASRAKEASGAAEPSGTPGQSLSLGGNEPFDVDSPPQRVIDMLLGVAARALGSPVGAVEFQAEGDKFVVRGLGSEGFRVLLYDNDDTTYYGSVWRDDPSAENGEVYTDSDEIDALIEQGKIPEGPVVLKQGDEVEIPLPEGTKAGDTGGFLFWRADRGDERRTLTGAWTL